MGYSNFLQFWALIDQSLPQSLRLCTVQLSFFDGVVPMQLPVNDALEIPPHGQHLLVWVMVTFWLRFWLLVAPYPLVLLAIVYVGHLLLIHGGYLLQGLFAWILREQ